MAMSVMVAGDDEVVDFGEGIFTRLEVLQCLSWSTRISIVAGAAVAVSI